MAEGDKAALFLNPGHGGETLSNADDFLESCHFLTELAASILIHAKPFSIAGIPFFALFRSIFLESRPSLGCISLLFSPSRPFAILWFHDHTQSIQQRSRQQQQVTSNIPFSLTTATFSSLAKNIPGCGHARLSCYRASTLVVGLTARPVLDSPG